MALCPSRRVLFELSEADALCLCRMNRQITSAAKDIIRKDIQDYTFKSAEGRKMPLAIVYSRGGAAVAQNLRPCRIEIQDCNGEAWSF